MIVPDEIWKILTKKVDSSKISEVVTAVEAEEKQNGKKIQIFELLVAETLNFYDYSFDWKATQSTKDKGIDVYGISKKETVVPFSNHTFRELSLGQVKHTKNSYGYDKFRTDIHKLKDGWKNVFNYQEYSLRQFLLVLASNSQKNIETLKKKMSIDNIDLGLLEDAFIANIDIIDGNLLIKSWKLNFNYYRNILKFVLTDEEISILETFINSIDFDWLNLSVDIENNNTKIYYVGEIFDIVITVVNDLSYLNSSLYFKWEPAEKTALELIYPLNAINPEKQGFRLEQTPSLYSSRQIKEFKFQFRGLHAGIFSAGKLLLCYDNGQVLKRIDLGVYELKCGITSKYLNEPIDSISYKKLKTIVQGQTKEILKIKSFLILGCGGIGKTTLIKELICIASANDFSCFSISQKNDTIHEKTIIFELFYRLAFPNIVLEDCKDKIISEIITKLNLSDYKEWENNLINYFNDKEDYSKEAVAECLSSLLITASTYQKLFIWITDCHWVSHSSFFILSRAIEILYKQNESIVNDIVFVFEGRNNESLRIGDELYRPIHWDDFISSENNECIILPHWEHRKAKEFLLNLFPTSLNQMSEKFIEKVLYYSDGIPMHIVQMMNLLLERECIKICDDGKISILKSYSEDIFSEDIIKVIEERIDYYENKYSLFTDILTIVAVLNDSINPRLNDWLVQKLNLNSQNKDIIKKSGFISDVEKIRTGISFQHEHYRTVFKNRLVSNESLIVDCIEYYRQIEDLKDIDYLNLIYLKNLFQIRDFKEILSECISLLNTTSSSKIRLSILKYIVSLPEQVYCEKMPKYLINFEICELILRDGDWDLGLLYLNKTLEEKKLTDIRNIEYLLMAYQEKANILADRLLFEEAVDVSNDGILLAQQAIANPTFYDHLDRLNLLKNKLQARLAVCIWFYGDYSKAKTIQLNCINDAKERGDKYSEYHVSYELETLNLHWEHTETIENLKAILDLIDRREIISLDSERTLIETQMIIGQLITACSEGNNEWLNEIRNSLTNLLVGYKIRPHIYEEFLCHTMKAVLDYYQNDLNNALFELTEALRVSTLSNMLNLEWKGYVNLAQFLYSIGDSRCISYAESAKNIIMDSLSHNTNVSETYKKMITPVTEILERILQISIPIFHSTNSHSCVDMLCVKVKEITFFIMN